MARETDRVRGPASPSRIRWGAVLAAAVITIALLTILSTLWGALAYGTGVSAVEDNLAWFVGGSAIVVAFVGGLAAGWMSGVPGAGVGAIHGLTVWALLLVAAMVFAVPGLVGTLGGLAVTPQVDTQATGEALWVTFLALLIGGLAAVIGGAIGGVLTRPAAVLAPHTHQDDASPTLRTDQGPVSQKRAESTAPVRSHPGSASAPAAAGQPQPTQPSAGSTSQPSPGASSEPSPGPASEPSPGPASEPSPGPASEPSPGPAYQPVPPEGESRGGRGGEGEGRWPYVESDLR